jgi:hypothetical protein
MPGYYFKHFTHMVQELKCISGGLCTLPLYIRGDQIIDRELQVDHRRFLVSIKIYLPPQYDQTFFVLQHFLDHPAYA